MAISFNTTLRNNRADAITTFAGTGARIRIYTAGYATLLAELTISGALAPAASGGSLTLNSITADSSADASGTAAIARIYKSDGTTIVMEGLTVGTSGCNINLNSASISAGQTVSITSATITEGNA